MSGEVVPTAKGYMLAILGQYMPRLALWSIEFRYKTGIKNCTVDGGRLTIFTSGGMSALNFVKR